MGRDRSLDEFFGGESNASPASNGDSGGDEAGESGAATEADDSDAATRTVDSDTEPEPNVDDASATTPDPGDTVADPDREVDEADPPDTRTEDDEADPPDTRTEDDEPDPPDGGQTERPSDDIEPARVTYRWEPGGVRCAECEAAAEQLWSGESGLVCAECKEW